MPGRLKGQTGVAIAMWVVVALLAAVVVSMLLGCAWSGTLTEPQRARNELYVVERAIDAVYLDIWVDVHRGRLPKEQGAEARRTYTQLYGPAKEEAARMLAEWDITGKRPNNYLTVVATIRRAYLYLVEIKENKGGRRNYYHVDRGCVEVGRLAD